MHSSVCAPATTRPPTPRSESAAASLLSWNAAGERFSTPASASPGSTSGTMPHGSLPRGRCSSSSCWTHTTRTCAPRPLDEAGDVGADGVALVGALDDAVLQVDDDECGVRPVLECAHAPTVKRPSG